MNRFLKAVRVVANPFSALDHKARPCGAFPQEPSAVGSHLGYVGAHIDRSRTVVRGSKDAGDIREPLQDTVYTFSAEPVTVNATEYYRSAVRSGALLAADVACAKWAGVEFVEPVKALEAARVKADADFASLYGAEAIPFLRGEPAPEAPAEAPVAAPETQASAPSEDAANETTAPAAKRGNQGAKS